MKKLTLGICCAAAALAGAAHLLFKAYPDPEMPGSPGPSSANQARALSSQSSSASGAGQSVGTTPPLTAATFPDGEDIGSEGYGPHILRAASEHDPAKSFEALQWITQCASNARVQEYVEKLRSNPDVPSDRVKGEFELAQSNGRRCQTVTPDMGALKVGLALDAVKGSIKGAALYYAAEVHYQFPQELKQIVAGQLASAAASGDFGATFGIAAFGDRMDVPPREQLVYQIAIDRLRASPPFDQMVPLWNARAGDLTAEQQADAGEAAQRIVDAVQANYARPRKLVPG